MNNQSDLLKTSKEWHEELTPMLMILDPDGWDRKNYDYSFNKELITKKEYYKRASVSTCQWAQLSDWLEGAKND